MVLYLIQVCNPHLHGSGACARTPRSAFATMGASAGLSPAEAARISDAVADAPTKAARAAAIDLSADSQTTAAVAPSADGKPPKMRTKSGSFSNLMAALKRKGSSTSLAESDPAVAPTDR